MSTYYQFEQPRFQFGFGGITYGVQSLILLNVVVFAAQLLVDIPLGTAPLRAAPGGPVLEWLEFSRADFLRGHIWGAVTYMFLHSGLSHLFWNMLMLFFFGPSVERALGTSQFVRFYLLCGTLGVMTNLMPLVFGTELPGLRVVGASGAALGVLVAFAILEPERKVFLFPIPFPIYARGLVMFIVVMNLMTAIGGGGATSVATHFGGMIVAYGYMKVRPHLSAWQLARRRKKTAVKAEDEDQLAEAIDNIFKFQDKE